MGALPDGFPDPRSPGAPPEVVVSDLSLECASQVSAHLPRAPPSDVVDLSLVVPAVPCVGLPGVALVIRGRSSEMLGYTRCCRVSRYYTRTGKQQGGDPSGGGSYLRTARSWFLLSYSRAPRGCSVGRMRGLFLI